MSQTNEVKNATDLVVLENITEDKSDVQFQFNGNSYIIKAGSKDRLARQIAEHGVKKSLVYATGKRGLQIVELPADQRDPRRFTASDETISKKQGEIDALIDENAELKKQNAELQERLDELEGKTPEKKKPGRPRGS